MDKSDLAKPAFWKKCSYCGASWEDRDDFLTDQSIDLVGYQPNFKDLGLGLFLFNHNNCHSTMAIYAEQFRTLYDGPVFSERRTGEEDCRGMCLHKDELGLCPVKCECAYVREIINIVRKWPKASAA